MFPTSSNYPGNNEEDAFQIKQEPKEGIETNFQVYICQVCNIPCAEAVSSCPHINQNNQLLALNKPEIIHSVFEAVADQIDHPRPENIPEKHMCNICGKVFSKKSYLQKHTSNHHSNKESFICDLCGYKNQYKVHLKNHMYQKHMNVRLQCPQCPKIFKFDLSLQKHLKVHQAYELPPSFTCEQCHKVYRSKDLLTSHYRNVHSPLEYNCSFCPYTNKLLNRLNNHIKVVHGDLPKTIKCSDCNKMFRTNADIYSHKRSVHSDRTYNCSICGSQFKRNTDLTKHTKKFHDNVIENSVESASSFCEVQVDNIKEEKEEINEIN